MNSIFGGRRETMVIAYTCMARIVDFGMKNLSKIIPLCVNLHCCHQELYQDKKITNLNNIFINSNLNVGRTSTIFDTILIIHNIVTKEI
jgi:hypothetical protein